MNYPHIGHRQKGAALVIGLILLAIITLLAVVGMNMSNSELQSATSEQLRLRAFQAAETGVERALPGLYSVGTGLGATITGPTTAIDGSPINPATGLAQDSYQTTSRFIDYGTLPPGGSVGKMTVMHFSVTSTGTSARNASAQIVQGAWILSSSTP